MDLLSWLGLSAFCAVSLVVGVRLLRLWIHSRELPELLVGAGLLLMGPLGFILTVLSDFIAPHSLPLGRVCWGLAFAALNVGSAATWAFTLVVFHRRRAWSKRLITSVAVLLAACWVVELSRAGFDPTLPSGPAVRVSDWLRTFSLLWAALESLRYCPRMRRRQRLGLADPVVANRFLLWGAGIGAAGIGSAIDSSMKLFVAHALHIPWVSLVSSLTGGIAAAAVLLAFLPTRRYKHWIRARAVVAPQGEAPAFTRTI